MLRSGPDTDERSLYGDYSKSRRRCDLRLCKSKIRLVLTPSSLISRQLDARFSNPAGHHRRSLNRYHHFHASFTC